MPYEWLPPGPAGQRELHLWPHRSLPKRGFVWFIGGSAALISAPLFAVLGTVILWGLLPFMVAAIAGVWWALSRSYRDAEILEVLQFTDDHVVLTRQARTKPLQRWQANPYWVSTHLHTTKGPVPNYLTLKGNGREVEIGAFLSEGERIALRNELDDQLRKLREVPRQP